MNDKASTEATTNTQEVAFEVLISWQQAYAAAHLMDSTVVTVQNDPQKFTKPMHIGLLLGGLGIILAKNGVTLNSDNLSQNLDLVLQFNQAAHAAFAEMKAKQQQAPTTVQ